MKPHVIPRAILKQFDNGIYDEPSVNVLYKQEMIYRVRGIKHHIFTTQSNYYGDGEDGSLEFELATNDESSLNNIIQIIREGKEIDKIKEDLHFLLWNNIARNPLFREHPKVENLPYLTSENFHRSAMDSIPDEYLSFGIAPIHIKNSSKKLILPDFNIKYVVLAPDVVLIRTINSEAETFVKFVMNDEDNFVDTINKESFDNASNWLVSESEKQFEVYGATKFVRL
jgi:hypothetical protein